LKISDFKTLINYGIIGEEAEFNIKISNAGLNQSGSYTINIFRDVNADSIPQPGETLTQINGNPLASGDSTQLSFTTTNFSEGTNYFIALLETTPDEDTTNNIAFTDLIWVCNKLEMILSLMR
jgi:hypothetical protein